MTEVVSEAEGFGQVFVQSQCPGDRPADLRNFDAVREPDAEMIAVGRDEDLRLVPQPTKADRMDDTVAVALEDIARAPWAGVRFRMKAAARARGLRSDAGRKAHSVPSGTI